jgi:ferredoxin
MIKINPNLIKDIKKYGAFDVSKCFNCGNCTAVCPLAKAESPFPRHLIRRAFLGDKKALLSAKGTWLCFYCGECSKTCPREAKPAAFMAAARRYAIANADVTGFSKILYKFPLLNFILMALIAVVFALFMYGSRLQGRSTEKIIEIFNIPFELIHWFGIGLMVAAAVALISGMIIITLRAGDIQAVYRIYKEGKNPKKAQLFTFEFIKTSIKTVLNEMFAFKRFRDCDADKKEIPWYLKPWLLHGAVAWGFMGLFGATTLNFLFKDPAIKVSLLYPTRMLGILSGISMLYGATIIIIKRIIGKETNYADSTFADWWLILTLWFVGLTGFVLTVLVYLPHVNQTLADILFVAHVAPAMQVIIMIAFTKLAHIFYRMHALLVHELMDSLKAAVK